MRCVKALMIGRLSLTWLWAVLWLIALPNTQARGLRPAESIPAAIVGTSASENHVSPDGGIYFHSTRSTRRFELEIAPDDAPTNLCLFQIDFQRDNNSFCFLNGSQAPPSLANGWQFLWRTALSPRAPSFVS